MTSVNKRNHIGERANVFFVSLGNTRDFGRILPQISACWRDESQKISKEIGDGDDLVAFVGANGTSLTAGVHAGADTGNIGEASQKKSLDNDRGAGASTYGDDFGLHN